jgi:SAM-dependent methyltransferase
VKAALRAFSKMFATNHYRRYRARLGMLKAWAEHDVSLYRAFMEATTSVGICPKAKRVLDIGCGANAPMTLMLHSAGVEVTGIDESIGHRWGLGFRLSRYYRQLRAAGFLRTCRKAAGELVYDRHYYRCLVEALGFAVTEEAIDIREMRAENLEFEDGTFDLVYSNATWEHLQDVRKANQELARVLRPGGMAYIEIHLFPSLSGGHDLPWIVPGRIELGGVVPWAHLRDPAWREPVYLNRLRERDYRRLFEETPQLDILDWRTEFTEGEGLVTSQLLAELPGYTCEELTKRSVVIVLRRRESQCTGGPSRRMSMEWENRVTVRYEDVPCAES